eukprot:68452_1
MASSITDPDQITRLICLLITILSNLLLFAFVCYAVFYQKQQQLKIIPTGSPKSSNVAKKWNYCLLCFIAALFLQFFVPFYNFIYRFIIPNTYTACLINDTIEEIIVHLNRLVLLIFYIIRLKQIFARSTHAISRSIFIFLLSYAIIISTVLPAIFIATQDISNRNVSGFGVYCSNTGNPSVVITYFILDFTLTIIK